MAYKIDTGHRKAGGGKKGWPLGFLRLLVGAFLMLGHGTSSLIAQSPFGVHWCGTCQTNFATKWDKNFQQTMPWLTKQATLPQGLQPAASPNINGGSSDVSGRPDISWSTGAKRLLVMRVDFSDLPGPPVFTPTGEAITPEFITNIIHGVKGVRRFIEVSSFNQATLICGLSDITPVLRMTNTAAFYATNGNVGSLNPQAYAQAQALGYSLSNYDRLAVVHDVATIPGALVAFGGGAVLGGNDIIINSHFGVPVVAHELIHNYGINHANRWQPSDGSSLGTAQDLAVQPSSTNYAALSQEYGGVYELMGGTYGFNFNGQLNHWFRNLLHWYPDALVTGVTNSGIFRVFCFDHTNAISTGGPLALKVGRDAVRDYWVGYRRHLNEPTLNVAKGATLQWGYKFMRQSDLIVVTTPTSNNLAKAALEVGQTFMDTPAGISFTTLGQGGTEAGEYLDMQITFASHIGFASTNVTAVQAGGVAQLVLSRVLNSTGAVSVAYLTASGSAVSPADFTATTGLISWADGDMASKIITVPVGANASALNRTFSLQLTNITGGAFYQTNALVTIAAAPANDNFASRLPISIFSELVIGANFGASKEAVEPNHAGNAGGKSVWWTWTAPASWQVTVDTVGSSFDTTLAVYTGSLVNNLAVIAQDNDSAGGGASRVSFSAVAGMTYQMAVDGFNGAAGNIVLNLSRPPAKPVITAQPQSVYLNPGQTASFSVAAQGLGLAYQWQRNGANLLGATASSLTVSGVTTNETGSYIVLVSNAGGTVASALTRLDLPTPPSIATQPQSQTVLQGATAAFAPAITASPPLSCQWFKDGVPLAGATNTSLFVAAVDSRDTGGYSVMISNIMGVTTSAVANLTVTLTAASPNAAPAPTGMVSWWTGDGTAVDRVGFNNGALIYGATYGPGRVGQAYLLNGTNAAVEVPTPGFDSTLVLSPYAGGLEELTNAISIEAWIRVTQFSKTWQAVVTKGDNSWGLQRNANSSSLHFVTRGLSNSDMSGTRNVEDGQWHHVVATYDGARKFLYVDGTLDTSAPATGSILVDGQHVRIGDNFQVSGRAFWGSIDDVRTYNRALAASEIQAIYAAGTNGMAPPARPFVASQPQGQSVFVSNSVTLSVQVTGSTPLRYQWHLNGNNLSGATNSSLTFASAQLADTGSYSVIVSNALGMVTSSNALLTVLAPPQITAQPQSRTVSAGNSATFSVFATGTAPLSYQWRLNGSPIVGATNTTLSLASVGLANEGIYSVSVSNLVSVTTSTNVTLTVLSPPVITAGPQSQTVLSGTTVSLSVTVVGTAPLTYQWRKDGVNIGGATGTNHTLSNIQTNQTATYSVLVSNAYGTATGAALITVTPGPLAPAIVTQPQSQTVRAGTNVTLTVLATGYPAPDYQWVKSGVAVPGVNSPTLVLTNVNLADAGNYYVQIFNSSGVTNSAVAILTVHTLPSFTTQPQPTAVTPGNAAAFTVAVDGVPSPALSWFRDATRLTNSAGISGATATTLLVFVTGMNQAGNYFAVATNAAGSSTSSVVALTVLLPPVITTHPTNVLLLRTNLANVLPATFNVVATGTAPLLYQWRFNGGDLAGATNPAFNLTNVTRVDNGTYSVMVSNTVGTATSSNALLRVRVPQRLALPERLPDGRMRLVFLDDLGGMPGSNDMSYVEVQFATNLLATNVVWSRLTNAVTVTNGMLLLDEPPGMTGSRRFYQVIER